VFAALAIVLLVVPFAELYILITAGQTIGVVPTLVLVAAVSVAGAFLVKQQGLGLIRAARVQVEQGNVPGREVVDGILVLLAGVLLLTPGFVTDGIGLALLVPPVRSFLRSGATRWFQRRVDLRVERGWSHG